MRQHAKRNAAHVARRVVLGALVTGTLMAGTSQAATFNTSNAQQHADWQSVTLSRGSGDQAERHFRAVENTSYSDTVLSVNATPGVCDMPWLEVRVALENQQEEDRTADIVPARLRVDDKTLRSSIAEFITERGDEGFYAHFYLNDRQGLFDDMRHGKRLFLGFEQGERDPWYMTFSLDGANAAIGEMLKACRRASRS